QRREAEELPRPSRPPPTHRAAEDDSRSSALQLFPFPIVRVQAAISPREKPKVYSKSFSACSKAWRKAALRLLFPELPGQALGHLDSQRAHRSFSISLRKSDGLTAAIPHFS